MTTGTVPGSAGPEIRVEGEGDGESRAIVAPRLRLSFRWTGDRWAHALEWPGLAVARSVESDPEAGRDGPTPVAGPAFQQLGFQESGAVVRALLVGQAGPHHFSASFTVREEGGATIVEVDVADRCRAEAPAPASTYTVGLTSGDLRDADPARIAWEVGGDRLRFEAAGPPAVLALAEAGRAATRVQALAPGRPESATRRWAYRWVREPNTNQGPEA